MACRSKCLYCGREVDLMNFKSAIDLEYNYRGPCAVTEKTDDALHSDGAHLRHTTER